MFHMRYKTEEGQGEEGWWLYSYRVQEVSRIYIGPLQCSCLENPKDGGAWWAAVYGVAQSWIRLKRLSSNSRISRGEGRGTPLQRSCLENPMDGGAWLAAVHGVARSWTRLSDFTFTFHFHALEKEMATHSSVPAWRIPGMEEPGGLPSVGSHRVGHNWSDLAAAAAAGFLEVRMQRLENYLHSGVSWNSWVLEMK